LLVSKLKGTYLCQLNHHRHSAGARLTAHVRDLFAAANTEARMALARQPAAHEEMLDFQIFAALDRVGPTVMSKSGAALLIDTHWLGGRRHWGGRWEIGLLPVLKTPSLGVMMEPEVGYRVTEIWARVQS
jgi:hypothetical protein